MQVPSLEKITLTRTGSDWILKVDAIAGVQTFNVSLHAYSMEVKPSTGGMHEVTVNQLSSSSTANHWLEIESEREEDPVFAFKKMPFGGNDVACMRVGIGDIIMHVKFYDDPAATSGQEVILYFGNRAGNKTEYRLGHMKI